MSRADQGEHKSTARWRVTRRGLVVLSLVGIGSAGAFRARRFDSFLEYDHEALTPVEAHAAAASGTVLLIDIRQPEEWLQTGIGEHAIALDMRREDFADALLAEAAGDAARPIALICARGVRSRRLSKNLSAAGFSRVVDVPEGMLGSGAGPGWLTRGLPVVAAI